MPTLIYNTCAYVALEKTAITRLISYFGTSYNLPNTDSEQIFYPAKHVFDSNTKVSEVKKQHPDQFYFSFVRNPFDRSVSHYASMRFSDPNRPEYINFTTYMLSPKFNNLPPMTDHLDVAIDFIGRFESLKEDFTRLHNILNLNVPDPHPITIVKNDSNRRKGKHFSEFYTPETIAYAVHKYQKDFETFGYNPKF